MLNSSLIAFAHFAAAFGIVGALAFEFFTFNRHPTLAEARRLANVDRLYGLSAVALLIFGFARAYHFEKGWAYYGANPVFHAKIGLFILIGLLSIAPTVAFIRWGKDLKAGNAPQMTDAQHARVRLCLNLQIALLVPLALCASLMAHGFGA